VICLTVNEIRRMHAICADRPARSAITCAGRRGGAGTRPAPGTAITSGGENETVNWRSLVTVTVVEVRR
jgi:hypothetical protein